MLTDQVSVYENQHLWRWGYVPSPLSHRFHILTTSGSECGLRGIYPSAPPTEVEQVCGSCARIVRLKTAHRDMEARR